MLACLLPACATNAARFRGFFLFSLSLTIFFLSYAWASFCTENKALTTARSGLWIDTHTHTRSSVRLMACLGGRFTHLCCCAALKGLVVKRERYASYRVCSMEPGYWINKINIILYHLFKYMLHKLPFCLKMRHMYLSEKKRKENFHEI